VLPLTGQVPIASFIVLTKKGSYDGHSRTLDWKKIKREVEDLMVFDNFVELELHN
jgi:hypothetical protein